jgi:hypothetical protein
LVKGILNCSNKELGPLQRGDNYKIVKMGRGHLKLFFSRTTEPDLQLSDIMWIQNCSHHGPRELGGATLGKTIFTCVYIEKKIFSRTSRPISIKLSVNHPWVKGILNCSNKGRNPLQRGDNNNNANME